MDLGISQWRVVSIVVALALSACGGGGNGGGGGGEGSPVPVPAPTPSFTLGTNNVAVQSAVNEGPTQEVSIPVNLVAIPEDSTIYGRIRISSSEDVIDNAFFQFDAGLKLKFILKHPSSLAPAAYDVQMELTLCVESTCSAPLAGSPARIAITYTVTRPTGALAPRLSSANNAMSLESLYFSPTSKRVEITLNHQNTFFYPRITTTHTSGIASVGNSSGINPYTSTFNVWLRSPVELGSGFHRESITFRACLDTNCINELEGSPLTVNVDHNVTDEMTLTNGHVLRATPIDHNESVWDPHSQRFYFIIPARDSGSDDMVGWYNPVTRTRSTPVPVGQLAQGLALSDDGQFLYAGSRISNAVQRFSLPDLTPNLTIPMGSSLDGSIQLYPRSISVVPGQSRSIVVAASGDGRPGSELVAVYDDAVRRPTVILRSDTIYEPFVESMCFNPIDGRLFGTRTSRSGATGFDTAIYEMTVTPTGIRLDDTTLDFGYRENFLPRRVHCTPTRVYSPDSFVFNPTDNSVFDRFPTRVGEPFNITVRVPRSRIFGGGRVGYTLVTFLRSYDLNSFTQVDELILPDDVSPAFRQLDTWGPQGIAFEIPGNGSNTRAYGKHFVTVEGPMFGP